MYFLTENKIIIVLIKILFVLGRNLMHFALLQLTNILINLRQTIKKIQFEIAAQSRA